MQEDTLTRHLIAAAVLGSLSAVSLSFPAHALTSKECSAKYKAAQAAGTTGNLRYADYRKTECGTGASVMPASPIAAPVAKPAGIPAAAPTSAPAPARRTASKPTATPSGAVFPTAISPKYSAETAGKQRMHTCLDQYNANKATSANGGLKWIEKGGGYYSQCNSRLKG
jgi:hypothetical protein